MMEHNHAIYLKSVLKSIDLISQKEVDTLGINKEFMSKTLVDLSNVLDTLNEDNHRLTLLSLLFVAELYRAKHGKMDISDPVDRLIAVVTFIQSPLRSAMACFDEGYKALTTHDGRLTPEEAKKVYKQ